MPPARVEHGGDAEVGERVRCLPEVFPAPPRIRVDEDGPGIRVAGVPRALGQREDGEAQWVSVPARHPPQHLERPVAPHAAPQEQQAPPEEAPEVADVVGAPAADPAVVAVVVVPGEDDGARVVCVSVELEEVVPPVCDAAVHLGLVVVVTRDDAVELGACVHVDALEDPVVVGRDGGAREKEGDLARGRGDPAVVHLAGVERPFKFLPEGQRPHLFAKVFGRILILVCVEEVSRLSLHGRPERLGQPLEVPPPRGVCPRRHAGTHERQDVWQALLEAPEVGRVVVEATHDFL